MSTAAAIPNPFVYGRRVHKRAVELPLARTAPKARGWPQNLAPGLRLFGVRL